MCPNKTTIFRYAGSNESEVSEMKVLSKVLFIIGLIILCAGMITMKQFNYLIPSIIGCIGLMLMMTGIDIEEVNNEGIY